MTFKKRLNKKLSILGKKETFINRIFFIIHYQVEARSKASKKT